jgi:predicted transcriptional regulator
MARQLDAEPTVVKSIRLTPNEWEAVDALAEQRGMTRTALLRRMVQQVLKGEAAKAARTDVTTHFKK